MTWRRWSGAYAAAAAAAVCWAGSASAEPEVPPVIPGPVPAPAPAPAELLPAIGNVLAQAGNEPAGPFGLPDLSSYGPNLLLGQTVQPSLPGTPAASVPDLRAFTPEYLLPLNQTPAPPGQGTPAAGIAPNEDIPGTGRIAFLRRLYEMYQAGDLQGALLGQQPAEQFGTGAGAPPAG